MASNVTDYFKDKVEKDMTFIRRVAYDVLVYVLPKMGYPKEKLPTTDLEENEYYSREFISKAGLSAMRVSLLLRDRWRQMFRSRKKVSGFTEDTIHNYLKLVVLCCPLSWSDTTQSVVESFLALCNEIVLFFHHENIKIDTNVILNSVSKYITGFVAPYPNVPGQTELLLSKIYNIPGYSQWMFQFIDKYAIPYGSRDDVSFYFFGYVRKQWSDFSRMPSFPQRLTITALREYLGFLPVDYFTIIESADPSEIPENVVSAPETILPDELDPNDSRNYPRNFGSFADGGEGPSGMCSTRSTDHSKDTVKGGECSKASSELGIEEEFGQLGLNTEASQPSQGAIPKRKKSKKKKKK